jgi:hypothetical protein
MSDSLQDDPLFRALMDRAIEAECVEESPGRWRCKLSPDGFGPLPHAARANALEAAAALLAESIRPSSPSRGKGR